MGGEKLACLRASRRLREEVRVRHATHTHTHTRACARSGVRSTVRVSIELSIRLCARALLSCVMRHASWPLGVLVGIPLHTGRAAARKPARQCS